MEPVPSRSGGREAETATRDLRALDERFAPVTAANVLIAELDPTGHIGYVSPNAGEFLGRSRAELLGTRALELVHPDDRDDAEAWLAELRATGRSLRRSYRVLRPDGELRWLESSGSTQGDGSAKRAFVVTRDVTETRLAQQALQESEERFQTAFRAAPAMMVVTETDGTIIDVNESFARACGWQRDELVGKTGVALGMWSDVPRRDEIMARIEGDGALRGVEARFRRRSGEPVWARLYAERTLLGGRPCLLWQAVDVTDLKLAEQERDASRERLEQLVKDRTGQLAESRDELEQKLLELRASAERYRSLAENAHDLIGEWDPEGRLVYANPAWETILGWKREELLDLRIDRILHPGDLAEGLARFRELLETGRPYRQLFRIRHHEGGWRWVDGHVNPFHSSGGELRVMAIARDVTEQRRLREQLERSERLASIGTLAAGIAHEINNPVESILLAAQYAQRFQDSPDAGRVAGQALEDVVENARRCGRIVRGVLHFAQQRATDQWDHDLSEVVRSAIDLVRREARRRAVSLETRLAEEPLPVRINATQIEQVLTNLVQNALANAECTHVLVSTEARPGVARVVVLDDGPGIDEAERRHVFDPFFTTRRETGGTGLGLSVSHGIVAQHGGRIELASAPGSGTRVTIDLPLYEAEERTDEPRRAEED